MTTQIGTTVDVLSPVRIARLAWRESRPTVQVVFALRFLSGAVLAGGTAAASPQVLWGLACWGCVVAAIYLRNGAADVVEDRHNGHRRPIAAGALPAPTARTVAEGLALTGLCLSLVSVPRPGLTVLAGAMLALGWAYSTGRRPLKNTVGGFVVTVVCGGALTYAAGALVSGGLLGGGRSSVELVCAGLAMSCWMGMAGATKDLPDVEGDRMAGRRTLPVLLGPARAAASIALGTLAVGGGFLAASLHWSPRLLPMAVVLAAGAVVVAALLMRARATPGAGQRRPYRAFMLTQYLAHLILLLELAFLAG